MLHCAQNLPQYQGQVREFKQKQNADEMWQLQIALGDPTFDQLSRARDYTQELRTSNTDALAREKERCVPDADEGA
jgi:hypothetical protein